MGNPLRVLIVDDERLARTYLRRLVDAIENIECVGEAPSADAALVLIRATNPDVVLLDVQMPEKDGFHVVKHLPQTEMPAVIFVTAHDHYAVKAFDVHATDYLLKPPDPNRLADALNTARRRMQSDAFAREQTHLRELVERLSMPATGASELIARDRGRVLKIQVADIDWLQAEDNYVRIHVNGSSHLIRRTIASLERDLDADMFLRIHRSAIVNVQRARELRRSLRGGFTIVLNSGEKLRVSRAHRRRVADLFKTNTRSKAPLNEPPATTSR